MSLITNVLLLVVATSAQGKLMPWQKIPQVRALKPPSPTMIQKNRHLQASLMTANCTEKCPTVIAMLGAAAQANTSNMSSLAENLCPQIDAMMCVMATPACTADDGTKAMVSGLAMLPCMCKCPSVTAMVAAFQGMEGDPTMKDMCLHAEAYKCMLSTDECANAAAEMDAAQVAPIMPCLCSSCPALADLMSNDDDDDKGDSDSNSTDANPTAAECSMASCLGGAENCAPVIKNMIGQEEYAQTKKFCDSTTTTAAPTTAEPAATTDFATTQAAPAVVMVLSVIALAA